MIADGRLPSDCRHMLLVKVGELVHRGDQVARAGSTGRSTGAHVHFEVWRDGRVVNPSRFLGANRPPKRG